MVITILKPMIRVNHCEQCSQVHTLIEVEKEINSNEFYFNCPGNQQHKRAPGKVNITKLLEEQFQKSLKKETVSENVSSEDKEKYESYIAKLETQVSDLKAENKELVETAAKNKIVEPTTEKEEADEKVFSEDSQKIRKASEREAE